MTERVLSRIVELDLDRCQNVYGVSPCTAGRKHSGMAQAGGANTITLAAGASAVDDAYKDMTVRLTGGTGAGQERKVVAYNGTTKIATLDANWTTVPDVTSTYDVIDRPNACYNTFKFCQDKANYLRGTKTFTFTERGAPILVGVTARPYITRIAIAPTEIDPDKGLARRAMTTLSCGDETDSDVEMDPYIADRASPAGGTFWARLLARVHNYAGRPARVKTAFVDQGAWGATTIERYNIDNIKGPNRGEVQITLKDPIAQLTKVKIPKPTSGKLAVALGTNDTQLTMNAGNGAQYPNAGDARVGEQVIRYAHKHVAQGWNYSDSALEGWTTTNATATGGIDAVTLTATAADPQFRVGGLSIAGGANRYVRARIRQLVAGTWEGKLYYTTGVHGESGSYIKQIAEPSGLSAGGWVIVTFDMHALTAGGVDWSQETITGLRLDLVSSAAGSFEIDWIGYGVSSIFEADVLVWPDGTWRSQFGTTAVAQKIGDGVQLCQAWRNQPVWVVLKDLLNVVDPVDGTVLGVADSYIDLAGMQSEDNIWLGAKFYITTCLTDPEDADALLADLIRQTGGGVWWASIEQKVKYKIIGPQSPGALANNKFTDEAHILEDSIKVETLDKLRLSFVAMNYSLSRATANRKEEKNFERGEIFIDLDAESENEYGARASEVNYSRWFGAANAQAILQWAKRRISYYRDPPKKIEFKVDPKDAAAREGDLYDVETAQLPDERGQPLAARVLILRRQDNGDDLTLVARTTTFNRRYAFIAANGTPPYPNNNGYACIANAAGLMNDASSGYLII